MCVCVCEREELLLKVKEYVCILENRRSGQRCKTPTGEYVLFILTRQKHHCTSCNLFRLYDGMQKHVCIEQKQILDCHLRCMQQDGGVCGCVLLPYH